eukprot:scaffold12167_cov129-Cylindrotheca_fusiformis.AAC.2
MMFPIVQSQSVTRRPLCYKASVDTPLTVVPNASHMILLETPDVVAEHIVAFIQSPSSSNI